MDHFDADLLILGAGPAGLTAAQYGARANLKVLVIEQLAPGGQTLFIDKLENYPGNIGEKSGFEISQDMHRQAELFGAVFLTETVTALEKEGGGFKITLGNNEIRRGLGVIIATGSKYRTLNIPGEKEFYGRGVSYCATCDGPFFKNKRIMVVGGGDAACDEAQFLSHLSDQVMLVHRRERLRAQRALAERVLHNPGIETRFNTRLLEIRGQQGKVTSVVLEKTETGKKYEEETDGVFIFVGTLPQSTLVSGVEKDENGYIITNQNMETSVPGLFAAGDVRASPFRQVVVAAGEGAIAAHRAAGYIDTIKGEAYL
ncbi:MAG: thioredoxin-disulfide reductase [Spirochaetaceae bacterium]|jgi:thioredoxin reductase (NADPH)|nr:thioredoxin-disulfide reductase [Spirochaetaceae bacterium]